MGVVMMLVLSVSLLGSVEAAENAPATKQAQRVSAPKGVKYGKGIGSGKTVKISELFARMDAYEGKLVRVEGLVVAVCPKRGCWLRIGSDKQFQELQFKVQDGQIVFPMSAQGKYVVAEGIMRKVRLSLEQTISYLKEEAEERGELFDESKVKEPLVFPKLEGIGAVIRENK
ncbi:MAG: DUF4920 domain-containing protein [Elusimicrobiota bacterium]|nr:DUF4920 domain-containing protein [Elusimicrobiota bacterium]